MRLRRDDDKVAGDVGIEQPAEPKKADDIRAAGDHAEDGRKKKVKPHE